MCGKLLLVDLKEGTLCKFPISWIGRIWKNPDQIERTVGSIMDVGNYLIFVPAFFNCMWWFEKTTG